VLGGGSNVVLRRRIPGTVLLMRTRGFAVDPERNGSAIFTIAAGEEWHDAVQFSLGQGYGGLENLALIPGSAGAAPIQNIGAYGVELAQRFVRLRALDLETGRVYTFDSASCRFGYRESRFKEPGEEDLVMLDVSVRVSRKPDLVLDYPDVARELEAMECSRPDAVDVAHAIVQIRRRKLPDPRDVGNAGSFFKNPVVSKAVADSASARLPGLTIYATDGQVKLAAAQLIDRCGWKGVRRGNVGVWERQALVLVNFGGASAAELLELADAIRCDVAAKCGVELALEPRVLGQD
jgi:UDP-N-acetylmuramate dehydrogenase